jgi:hypothetical protein
MGAWGVGTFDNDSALDWMHDLIESNNLNELKKKLKSFNQPSGLMRFFSSKEEYIDEEQASSGLVAGEAIAALIGKPSDDLPEELIEWIQNNNFKISIKEIELARKAIKKIKEDSELMELWRESDEFNEWIAKLEDLERRLNNV